MVAWMPQAELAMIVVELAFTSQICELRYLAGLGVARPYLAEWDALVRD
jgi:hypothetical protein